MAGHVSCYLTNTEGINMLNMLQSLISKKFRALAPFGADALNGKKPGVLYSRKGIIDCTFDFYYIKHGLVYYVNYSYCNDPSHRQRLKELVHISDTKKKPTPREYFLLADYFHLNADYYTYCDVVNTWMEHNGYSFYEDINLCDLPKKLPAGFEDIVEKIHSTTFEWLNSEKPAKTGAMYADLYVINGKVCLITGAGKSDASKAISDKDIAYDRVEFINDDAGLSCKWCADTESLLVDYCIHMDTNKFNDIREVECYEYLQKAQGNITLLGTSIPSFYQVLKHSKCKMAIIPYTDTLEGKIKILEDYLFGLRKR